MARNAPSHLPQPPPAQWVLTSPGSSLIRGRALHCTVFRRVSLHGSLEGTVSFMKCPLGPLAGSSMSEFHQAGPQPRPQKDIAEQWSLKGCRSPRSSHLPSSPWRRPVLLPASLAGVESGWGVGGRCGPGEGKPPHVPAATSHPHPGGSRWLRPPSHPRYPEPGEDAQSQTSPFSGLGAVVEQGS